MDYKLRKQNLFLGTADVKKAYDAIRYGDHTEDRAMRYQNTAHCSHCGRRLVFERSYYRINGRCFCMACREFADEYILECYRDQFIYED